MRSLRFVPAVTAVISLVLVPSSALARRHPSPNGRCAINIHVVPREIVAGDQVVIFGRLRCVNPASAANQEVKLFHHLAGTPGFTFVQSTITDVHGFYVLYRADGVVETNRSWYVRSLGARSAARRIRVAAQVTLSGPPEGQLFTGFANRVTFTGSVSPADVGARVILQRQNAATGGQWHRIDRGVVGAGGNFTIVHTFVVPGDANIRALVRSQGRNIPSASNVLAYSISQAQNPELTIQASPDPIAFGEAVTISGKLAGGVNQPVTLLARSARQHGFARVAQVNTNATGEYSFPAQSPVNSTFYRVQTADCRTAPPRRVKACKARRLSSAVLYEGVKDVLTTQVSATIVQAGQAVTFSGAVSPDHTGHAIYLERQNAHGPGFHVIQVAFVGAGSTYAIVHRLYDPGTKVLRVSIPGGPENQGAASQPFTILVIPALASTLTPESPENSTLPPEGES
ncbi:MAG TPA: hypothetical protein VFV03_01435 [Solirubrobacteraceae bacterium]|nr:hypothetical protein [Solirubrobacteraceae bacterium]